MQAHASRMHPHMHSHARHSSAQRGTAIRHFLDTCRHVGGAHGLHKVQEVGAVHSGKRDGAHHQKQQQLLVQMLSGFLRHLAIKGCVDLGLLGVALLGPSGLGPLLGITPALRVCRSCRPCSTGLSSHMCVHLSLDLLSDTLALVLDVVHHRVHLTAHQLVAVIAFDLIMPLGAGVLHPNACEVFTDGVSRPARLLGDRGVGGVPINTTNLLHGSGAGRQKHKKHAEMVVGGLLWPAGCTCMMGMIWLQDCTMLGNCTVQEHVTCQTMHTISNQAMRRANNHVPGITPAYPPQNRFAPSYFAPMRQNGGPCAMPGALIGALSLALPASCAAYPGHGHFNQ
jgi:hypothetical protein